MIEMPEININLLKILRYLHKNYYFILKINFFLHRGSTLIKKKHPVVLQKCFAVKYLRCYEKNTLKDFPVT